MNGLVHRGRLRHLGTYRKRHERIRSVLRLTSNTMVSESKEGDEYVEPTGNVGNTER